MKNYSKTVFSNAKRILFWKKSDKNGFFPGNLYFLENNNTMYDVRHYIRFRKKTTRI